MRVIQLLPQTVAFSAGIALAVPLSWAADHDFSNGHPHHSLTGVSFPTRELSSRSASELPETTGSSLGIHGDEGLSPRSAPGGRAPSTLKSILKKKKAKPQPEAGVEGRPAPPHVAPPHAASGPPHVAPPHAPVSPHVAPLHANLLHANPLHSVPLHAVPPHAGPAVQAGAQGLIGQKINPNIHAEQPKHVQAQPVASGSGSSSGASGSGAGHSAHATGSRGDGFHGEGYVEPTLNVPPVPPREPKVHLPKPGKGLPLPHRGEIDPKERLVHHPNEGNSQVQPQPQSRHRSNLTFGTPSDLHSAIHGHGNSHSSGNEMSQPSTSKGKGRAKGSGSPNASDSEGSMHQDHPQSSGSESESQHSQPAAGHAVQRGGTQHASKPAQNSGRRKQRRGKIVAELVARALLDSLELD